MRYAMTITMRDGSKLSGAIVLLEVTSAADILKGTWLTLSDGPKHVVIATAHIAFVELTRADVPPAAATV